MPGFGESPSADAAATMQITEALPDIQLTFANDVHCAWAGAGALNPGICLIMGTGAMTWAVDHQGTSHRCGGWSEFFSDEGSGYWLGLETIRLFSQQSDGRLPRGPLYDIVQNHFHLVNDFDIVAIVEHELIGSRARLAALQPLLAQAADAGDATAIRTYAQAAEELARLVLATAQKMSPSPSPIPVWCVGGLTALETHLLAPIRQAIETNARSAIEFHSPKLTPCQGAILLAASHYAPDQAPPLTS
jgi:N-acetylglucosamine kinase-like BadF-type ATPase